jgi:hypothetical protein
MVIEPDDVAPLVSMLSPERLSSLIKLTGSQEMALELHQETLRLGTCLMAVTAAAEIALRNVVSENLGHHFGVPNWLIQPPVPFRWRDPEQKRSHTQSIAREGQSIQN